MNKGKGRDHINAKDMADEAVLRIRYLLDELKQSLNFASYKRLYQESSETNAVWYKYQNSHLNAFYNDCGYIARAMNKKLNSAINQVSTGLMLTIEQQDLLRADVMQAANGVYNGVLGQHNAIVASIAVAPSNTQPTGQRVIKSSRLPPVHQEITHMIHNKPVGSYGVVQYQRTGPNGTQQNVNMSWEAYIERKVRTEIQQEISTNMQAYGYQAGIVFYIAAFFGDCADDHAPYQGRIYYDQDWRDNIEDDALARRIDDYITSHNLMSVQQVTSDDPWLTTRPNCRHYFQFIGIDEVLEIENDKQLEEKRDEMDLNYNGSYKPEKYEALQEQRFNERKIREFKEDVRVAELELAALPPGTSVDILEQKKKDITYYENKVKEYQAHQRDLIKKYDNLSRDYNREKIGDIYDLGA